MSTKYIFIMKYQGIYAQGIIPNMDGRIAEEIPDDNTSLKMTEVMEKGVEVGRVGYIELDNTTKKMRARFGLEKTDAEAFFESIRVITAELNSQDRIAAENKAVDGKRPEFSAGDGSTGSYGADGPINKAIWAKASFEELLGCFTFVGRPKENRATNDYAIVPDALESILHSPAIYMNPDVESKMGLLGGVGGMGGEP